MEKKIIIPLLAFNEKCPICLEKDGSFFSLGCLHKIHLECCENLGSLDCPLCRRRMEELPECLKERILENAKKEEEIRLSEERAEIIRTYLDNHRQFLVSRATPQMEAIGALDFLRENGIPFFFLPSIIEITLFRNMPSPQPGVIFHTIFKMVLEWIERECDEDVSGDMEEVEEDEECFFEEEEIERSIRIRRI